MLAPDVVLRKLINGFTGAYLPNLELAVHASRGHPLAIGRDGDVPHRISMLLIGKNSLAITCTKVPYLHI
jgi:hypothetical protein